MQNSAAYLSSKAEQNSLTRQLIEPKQEIEIANVPPINANINSLVHKKERLQLVAIQVPLLNTPHITGLNSYENVTPNILEGERPIVVNPQKGKLFTFGINFNAGLAYTNTSLSSNDSERIQLLEVRQQGETDLETVDLGLGILLKHKSGIYLNTGVNYRRSATSLQFED